MRNHDWIIGIKDIINELTDERTDTQINNVFYLSVYCICINRVIVESGNYDMLRETIHNHFVASKLVSFDRFMWPIYSLLFHLNQLPYLRRVVSAKLAEKSLNDRVTCRKFQFVRNVQDLSTSKVWMQILFSFVCIQMLHIFRNLSDFRIVHPRFVFMFVKH